MSDNNNALLHLSIINREHCNLKDQVDLSDNFLMANYYSKELPQVLSQKMKLYRNIEEES